MAVLPYPVTEHAQSYKEPDLTVRRLSPGVLACSSYLNNLRTVPFPTELFKNTVLSLNIHKWLRVQSLIPEFCFFVQFLLLNEIMEKNVVDDRMPELKAHTLMYTCTVFAHSAAASPPVQCEVLPVTLAHTYSSGLADRHHRALVRFFRVEYSPAEAGLPPFLMAG